ncbi:hypothetical protein BDR04DRAFT_1114124 [Suillus decipiens]|nr:hypothetical protein BDR04DRAFT_1114124 [Suillus decipiens]
MAGTRISTRLKKPTEKAAVQPHRITKARTRAPRSKPSPKKSKKWKLAVSESSDDDLVDDSDDSIVTAAHDEEEPDDMDRGGPGSTMDGEDVSQSALHFLGSI